MSLREAIFAEYGLFWRIRAGFNLWMMGAPISWRKVFFGSRKKGTR